MVRSKKFVMAGVALAMVVALSSCWSTDQASDLDLINRDRAANGRSTLAGDQQLMAKTQAWSDHMAATGVLEHTGGGNKLDTSGVTGWCGLAENVGYGSSIAAVRAQFMGSAPHRADTLGAWDHVGTGVTLKNGTYWITELYKLSC